MTCWLDLIGILLIPFVIGIAMRPPRYCDKCRIDMWMEGQDKK